MKKLLLAVALAAMTAASALAATPASAKARPHSNTADSALDNDAVDAQQHAASKGGGYHRATAFEQVKAQCELFADRAPVRSTFVFGSPMFVAASGLGAGIRRSMDHARAFDQCMILKGFAHDN